MMLLVVVFLDHRFHVVQVRIDQGLHLQIIYQRFLMMVMFVERDGQGRRRIVVTDSLLGAARLFLHIAVVCFLGFLVDDGFSTS